MKYEFYKTLWGFSDSYRMAARLAKECGFSGIEGPAPLSREEGDGLLEALEEYQLSYISEISTTGYACPEPGRTAQEHLDALKSGIERAMHLRPRLYTTMAGNDLWSFSENLEFMMKAQEIVKSYGIRIGFETHRGRTFYHPKITQQLIKEIPSIELTIDFSHWCCVCERLVLDEMPEVLDMCARHVVHIHLRVGYNQGAQVPDPKSARYQDAVLAHLRWWRRLWLGQRERGFETVTMTPEFGPDGYQQVEESTGRPFGDLWEFNCYIADIARKEFIKAISHDGFNNS